MARPTTLFTGQRTDLPLEDVARLAGEWGCDGLEIACWGDHLDPCRWDDEAYVQGKLDVLARHGLKVWTISNHLTGQAVCDDPIDQRQPLSVEWEDAGMDRLVGAPEARGFVRRLSSYEPSAAAFDSAFRTK